VLLPTLRDGQIVVMDNLSAHKPKRVRALIEGRGLQATVSAYLFARLQLHRGSILEGQGVLRKIGARNI
jgi:hypothetical protein